MCSNIIYIIILQTYKNRSRAILKMAKGKSTRTEFRGFTIYTTFATLHFQVIDYPPGSIIPLWALYCPVAQTEVEGWLKGSWPEPLTHLSASQDSTTIWESRSPRVIDDWWFSSGALLTGPDILGRQDNLFPRLSLCIKLCVSHVVSIGLASEFDHVP